MGGMHQATCNPPPPVAGIKGDTVRFHEDAVNDEAHFHDDANNRKCTLDYQTFKKKYASWRKKMTNSLTMHGDDGSCVTFSPFTNPSKEQDVAIHVGGPMTSDAIKNLDVMAGY